MRVNLVAYSAARKNQKFLKIVKHAKKACVSGNNVSKGSARMRRTSQRDNLCGHGIRFARNGA